MAEKYTVALAGNPNVGKSSLFNALTGLHQHTGNWPGKTVATASGKCCCDGAEFELVDLPGTYSLSAHSPEEEVTAEYLSLGGADAVIVVCDATALERNLYLVMQILEITERVVVCVNLMDEAEKHGFPSSSACGSWGRAPGERKRSLPCCVPPLPPPASGNASRLPCAIPRRSRRGCSPCRRGWRSFSPDRRRTAGGWQCGCCSAIHPPLTQWKRASAGD